VRAISAPARGAHHASFVVVDEVLDHAVLREPRNPSLRSNGASPASCAYPVKAVQRAPKGNRRRLSNTQALKEGRT
jgi:hypothetical protein